MKEDQESLEVFAKSGVLPQLVSETGAETEPLIETIICDQLSGGANYVNAMPAELHLTRRTADGTEYEARYVQAPAAMEGQRQFGIELTALVNRYCRENQSGTPDFILAEHLISSLNNLDQSICARRDWFGGKEPAAQTTD